MYSCLFHLLRKRAVVSLKGLDKRTRYGVRSSKENTGRLIRREMKMLSHGKEKSTGKITRSGTCNSSKIARP